MPRVSRGGVAARPYCHYGMSELAPDVPPGRTLAAGVGGPVSAPPSERLVKSQARVRDLAEVFTPRQTVQEMLDLLPDEMWAVHPPATFLEPACGDGNFVAAILERKLQRVTDGYRRGDLPAGADIAAAVFHALAALASIYAVDISADNVVGGTPGHEIGARTRLVGMFSDWHAAVLGQRLTARSTVLRSAAWIVEHNILVGNMLAVDGAGQRTNRGDLPLIEYTFDPPTGTVSLVRTTLGDVMDRAGSEAAVELSLFELVEPEPLWLGPPSRLASVERMEAPELAGPARNGSRRGV